MGDLMIGLYVFVLAYPRRARGDHEGATHPSYAPDVGAIVVAAKADGTLQTVLGIAAIAMATVNVIGGFMVTDRMLAMFRKR